MCKVARRPVHEYRQLGIDYAVLDEGKRAAIDHARATSALIAAHGGRVVEASRGASAFVVELRGLQLAFVIEGLGTKSVLARQWWDATGQDRFADVGVDAVAAIVNDVCSVGAAPAVVNAYFATGDSEWYAGSSRMGSLLVGWRRGCELAGAVWGGGESPALPGLVSAEDVEIAGAAIGIVDESRGPVLGEALREGDAIVLVESSGLHANGASVARSVGEALPAGLRTRMPGGRELGDALLDASVIYAPLLAELARAGVRPSYLSHVTGHGLRKLMRASVDLSYVVERLPPVPEVLSFLVAAAGLDEREAYATFNMGAGFAVYARRGDADAVVAAAAACGLSAIVAGHVERGPRRVELAPLGITYRADELDLR
jgi:phosphoribosylformylglycinamidine cyclo-ligase